MTNTLEELREKHTQQSELAVFWSVIADHLPKSIERSALGDEATLNAFAVAYPQIKQYLVSTARRETLREVVGIVEKQKKRIPAFDSETGRRDVYAQALDDIITHLESELTQLTPNLIK